MPKIKVTSPDGQTAIINAPEGATQDEIKAYATQKFAEAQQGPQRTLQDGLRENTRLIQPTTPERLRYIQACAGKSTGMGDPPLINKRIVNKIKAIKSLIIFTGIAPTSLDAAPKN